MKTLITLAVAVVVSGAAYADEIKIKPGLWETTTNINVVLDMNGQQMNMPAPPKTTQECVTPEDATFSPDNLTDESCDISGIQSTSNSLAFSMTCAQGNGIVMNGQANFTVAADLESGTGEISMNGVLPRGTMNGTGTITSKRVSDC